MSTDVRTVYARPTHEYWGYGAGVEFESVILVKKNAPELLRAAFLKKELERRFIDDFWQYRLLSTCRTQVQDYQTVASGLCGIQQPCWIDYQEQSHFEGLGHPGSKMAEKNLVNVNISLNTLDESFRRKLEPRTASVERRLRAIEELSKAGIPVNVLMAPIVPGINGHELLPLMEEIAKRGAQSAGYIILRLNGSLKEMFSNWLETHYPDRKEKVLNQVSDAHGGQVNDNRFGKRMRGEGKLVEQINQSYKLGNRKFFNNKEIHKTTSSHFKRPTGQTSLF